MRKVSLHLRVVTRRIKTGWRWHLLSGQVALDSGTADTQTAAKVAGSIAKKSAREAFKP